MLKSARTNYLLGTAYAACRKPDEATAKFRTASEALSSEQIFWASLAAKRLPDFDQKLWQGRLQAAMVQAESRSETSSFAGWWFYNTGLLAAVLGNQQGGEEKFRKALLLPDRMLSYHLTRLARAQTVP